MKKFFDRLKQSSFVRIPLGIILIITGILGGFIPIFQKDGCLF